MQSIEDLIDIVRRFEPGAPLLGYVGEIRFPNYKNLEPETRIDFPFPLTVLVGANGSGKSSILHALYGAPKDKTTRDFWFSTELDPILEGKGLGPSRYIYSHWNAHINGFVETRKARVRSGTKLDYWEPTKIVAGDGMQELPSPPPPGAASDRWLPVERSVVHINFKAEISAFDRYFYFETGQNKEEKHAAMLREAKRLKYAIDCNISNLTLWNRRRVFENRQLSSEELKWVKFIIGYDYTSATLVRHTLYPGYRGEDISVLFERPTIRYSEAFAGSGEVSVVSSVVKLLGADDFSLVLLDEPETSLHPGAQRRFLNFLLDCIKNKKVQVVISTHSPEFVRGLPDNAIKVLEQTPSGHVTLANSSSPLVAFKRLGFPVPGRIRIIVEDAVAKEVVDVARRQLAEGESEVVEIVVVPGGAEMILAHYVPAAIAAADDTYVLLDGDKSFSAPLPQLETIPPAGESQLGDLIKGATGVEPALYLTGGNDEHLPEKKIAAQKRYIKWLQERVRFLPRRAPEEIVIFAAFPELTPELDGTAETAKQVLYKALEKTRPGLNAEQIALLSGYELANCEGPVSDVDQIKQLLDGFIVAWRSP